MADRNFNVIILGDSLAARVAAISLAKKGERILMFTHLHSPANPWLILSDALEDFLGRLGGRSCLTPPLPLQVLTPDTRTEIHGPLPLADELKREFPSGYASLQSILTRLEDLGDRVEESIKAAGGLPIHGLRSRLRFLRVGFARKISTRSLNRPFQQLLDECADPASREFLQTLMEGLSLTPLKELTVGEAALLWRSTVQQRSISTTAFEAFLKQRYEQFHGETENFETIKSLELQRSGLESVSLKDGHRCTADFYLLATPEALTLLPQQMQPHATGAPRTFVADLNEKKVSSLLAPRLILAGNPSLRATLTAAGDGRLCCRTQGLHGDTLTTEVVQERLRSLFPFSPLEVEMQPAGPPRIRQHKDDSAGNVFPGWKAKVALRKNLLNICAPVVLPSLGSSGEVMLGLSCANQIIRVKKL